MEKAHYILGFIILATFTCFDFPDIRLAQYCETDYFDASCPEGEALIIERAVYGRLHTGRCLQYETHIGCQSNVITQLDKFCSGRPSCRVLVTDLLQEIQNPCPPDFRGFLEASYICVPGNNDI